MNTREDARDFLVKLHSCISRTFYNNIESTQRGFGFILSYLERANKEVTAGDLSKKLNVSTARIAALLKKMEKNGLITRHTSQKDARQIIVEITPAGIALVDEMREQVLSKIELLFTQVSKEDLETYIRISHQIKDVMSE
ncbi:MAG: winged helix DNA-binding protein [Lachnospiraceae bacterium]|nr:winged helix DNA-binding protein [Lachnospiraceae bacterium]